MKILGAFLAYRPINTGKKKYRKSTKNTNFLGSQIKVFEVFDLSTAERGRKLKDNKN